MPKEQRDHALAEITKKAEAENRKPYLIPYGGSNAIGALVTARQCLKLHEQGLKPDWIVLATSSGNTSRYAVGRARNRQPGKDSWYQR